MLGGDGNEVIVAGRDKLLRNCARTNAAPGDPFILTHESVGHTESITGLALAGGDRMLLSIGADKTVKRWQAASAAARFTVDAHKGPVLAARFSPDGTRMITVGADSSARLWNIADGNIAEIKPVIVVDSFATGVSDVAWSPTGSQLAACGLDGTIRVFDIDCKPVRTLSDNGPGGSIGSVVQKTGESDLPGACGTCPLQPEWPTRPAWNRCRRQRPSSRGGCRPTR